MGKIAYDHHGVAESYLEVVVLGKLADVQRAAHARVWHADHVNWCDQFFVSHEAPKLGPGSLPCLQIDSNMTFFLASSPVG